MRLAYPAALLLAACGPVSNGPGPNGVALPSAADFRNAAIRSVAAYLEEPQFAAADLERGEIMSLACQACHPLAAGQADGLGPNLFGVFEREPAAMSDFEYSAAFRSAEIRWTPAALDAWLANPADFLPGNAMQFAGFRSAADRRDLIAFLLHKTSGREP